MHSAGNTGRHPVRGRTLILVISDMDSRYLKPWTLNGTRWTSLNEPLHSLRTG